MRHGTSYMRAQAVCDFRDETVGLMPWLMPWPMG